MSYFAQPSDPDAPSSVRQVLPSLRQIGAVWVGGAVGCGLRALVELWLGSGSGFPWGTLAVNLSGAFLLGLLVEVLLLRGDDSGVRRRARLLLGTGVLGGFTTYSSFALESVGLLRAGSVGLAAAYVAITFVVGTALAWAGIVVARAIGRRDGEAQR